MPERPKPVVLIVRDGWGRNPNPAHDAFNAVKQARTPRCDALLERYPSTLIHTSGEAVGLPEGTMGNSEVGHQNIGAGRVVNQDSVRISQAIRDGSFFNNEVLNDAVDRAKAQDQYVHLLGLASDAGVHALLEHLYGCLELCRRKGHDKVVIHAFTDGRDTGPFSAQGFINQIENKCAEVGVGRVVSIVGRYYAMDRDNRWERVKQAYDLLTGRGGELPNFATAGEAIQDYYHQPYSPSQQGDEFITPRTVGEDWYETRISNDNSVIFYNYRGDRPREIVRSFAMDSFEDQVPASPDSGKRGFDRGPKLRLHFVTMTSYEKELESMVHVAYPKPAAMPQIGGQYLADQGLTQFRCAETEKFAHVTFFFNSYHDEPFDGEHRSMPQSPKVATYDLQPEMSAAKVRDTVLDRIHAADGEDVIVVNFANGDMVGHTGKFDAAVKAIEAVDQAVGRIVDATLDQGGTLLVTADHGNAEQMWSPDNDAPHTSHTLYDVEAILVDPALEVGRALRQDGRLADIFPTLLTSLQMEAPEPMSGRSLLDV